MSTNTPAIAIVMGSQSDWPTLSQGAHVLEELQQPYETHILSAHRTPDRMFQFAANARDRGIQVIIAGAGGAAHLPGMIAAKTTLPVLGVPVSSKALNGLDSLLSIVQMPKGVPVGTLAIGTSGAVNAALLAMSILSLTDHPTAREKLEHYRERQSQQVIDTPNPELEPHS